MARCKLHWQRRGALVQNTFLTTPVYSNWAAHIVHVAQICENAHMHCHMNQTYHVTTDAHNTLQTPSWASLFSNSES